MNLLHNLSLAIYFRIDIVGSSIKFFFGNTSYHYPFLNYHDIESVLFHQNHPKLALSHQIEDTFVVKKK